MKILHLCLASFYIDKYSYQENILPRMHKLLGHDVQIIASTETYINGKELGYLEPSSYINEDGIPVKRISYVDWIPSKIVRKLRIYENFINDIEDFSPDVIFMHDVQFLSIVQIVKYAKKNKVKIVADGHADFSNSANTFISRWILHECLYKPFIKYSEPYIEKFYGTLPARVEFFQNVYKIPKEKVDFLPMGADDNLVKKTLNDITKSKVRKKFQINNEDFLIVTGGKIDLVKKQTLSLMKIVNDLNIDKIKLLIFGSVVDELKDEFELLLSNKVIYAGWASVLESYEYLSASDLVVFPGRHSVYWEQAAGLGKPLIVKLWDGTTHVDLGGNVLFISNNSELELKEYIKDIYCNPVKYKALKDNAKKGVKTFSYLEIAKKCLYDIED